MSTTPERLAANAANAQHSTGPRTPEGQARSSQNARTHGLTARDLVIAPNERGEFEELRRDYQASVQPQDGIQQSLFEELVGAAWNLRRIRRMEVRACSDMTLTASQLEKDLDRLVRYKTCIERTANQRRNPGHPARQRAPKRPPAKQRTRNFKTNPTPRCGAGCPPAVDCKSARYGTKKIVRSGKFTARSEPSAALKRTSACRAGC